MTALKQFISIIEAGIKVVTLADRMEYTLENLNANPNQFHVSFGHMCGAHDESKKKSRWLKKAWIEKRAKIGEHKLTSICPEWLRLTEDSNGFERYPGRPEIIERIFKEKLAGKGSEAIARDLNQQTVWLPESRKREGSPAGWRKSYIEKILSNRAVLGEFQPHTVETDKLGRRIRKPVGEPRKGYYPIVVEPELFYDVHQKMEQNRQLAGKGGGRTGKVSNLFGLIAKCGYCGASMALINKGSSPKGGKYLVCEAARRGLPICKRYPIRYDEFEELVLNHCKGLQPENILPGHEQRETEERAKRKRLAEVQGELDEVQKRIERLIDAIEDPDSSDDPKDLRIRMAERTAQRDRLAEEVKQLEKEIAALARSHEDTQTRLNSVRELLDYLEQAKGEDLIDVRRRLRQQLRELIDMIVFIPEGVDFSPKGASIIANKIMSILPAIADKNELFNYVTACHLAAVDNRSRGSYYVIYKGGSISIIKPKALHKLSVDFDNDRGRLMLLDERQDGTPVKRILSKPAPKK